MKRFIVLAFMISIAIMGCAGGTIRLDDIFSAPHTVLVEITGNGNADVGFYLNKRSTADTLPSHAYAPERKREEYLAHPLEKKAAEIPSDILKRSIHNRALPVKEAFTLERGDCLHICCKPSFTEEQIIIQITDDGKIVKKYFLKHGDPEKYIYYNI